MLGAWADPENPLSKIGDFRIGCGQYHDIIHNWRATSQFWVWSGLLFLFVLGFFYGWFFADVGPCAPNQGPSRAPTGALLKPH
jgi:hypothetical protein